MRSQFRLVALMTCSLVALVATGIVVFSKDLSLRGPDASPKLGSREDPGRSAHSAGHDHARQRCESAGRRRAAAGPGSSPKRLTNGCAVNERGIPECGTLFGSSLTANGDPTEWERTMGDHLGVRRTYFQSWQVDRAIETVEEDTAVGRVPWISFKPPYSWREMAAGKGDLWARDLASRLRQIDGPVWLAIHHEPEYDGDIALWTRMQERLAPMVRRLAPNVAYSIILTGWNSLWGPDPSLRLDALYPDTTIDLVGFDIYNKYGGGSGGAGHTDLKTRFFDEIASWAEAHGVAWGVAETGYRDAAAEDMPEWLSVTYDQMIATGGVALTYWNSTLGADDTTDFSLSTPRELRAFRETLRRSPKLTRSAVADAGCTAHSPPTGRR